MREIELGRARRLFQRKGSNEKWNKWETEKHGSAIQEKSYETKMTTTDIFFSSFSELILMKIHDAYFQGRHRT